jgi:uncharacterized caspase-like protein
MKKSITTLVLSLLVTLTATAQKTYLVSCGITEYPDPSMYTTICANDAKTIQWVYQKNNGAETALLINNQVTKQQVIAKMKQLYAKAKPEDQIVFFYSGHGMPGSLVLYDGDMPYERICEMMAQSKAKRKVVFLNCCYAGKMSNSTKKNSTTTKKISASTYRKMQVMLFLSSRPTETTLYTTQMTNCYFTAFLQRGLKGGADRNGDRKITAKELYNYVHKGVVNITDNKQHPVMWGKFDDNMVVMKW